MDPNPHSDVVRVPAFVRSARPTPRECSTLLERTRRAARHDAFTQLTTEITVVLHDSPHALALSNPLMPAIWGLTSKPARRYVTGWAGHHELHVLSPRALRERASRVSGSFEMLALAPASLYAKRVIVGTNRELAQARLPSRSWAELRWAWLVEGTARWLSGESGHARTVVGQYLHAGHRPQFPPSARDAPLLAPSLIELPWPSRRASAAIARLARRAALRAGPTRRSVAAHPGPRPVSGIEGEWRLRLRRSGRRRIIAGVAYDEELTNRVRELLVLEPDVVEKKMFGGVAFLIGGHIAVGVSNTGGLLMRTEHDETEELLTQPARRAAVRRCAKTAGDERLGASPRRRRRRSGTTEAEALGRCPASASRGRCRRSEAQHPQRVGT